MREIALCLLVFAVASICIGQTPICLSLPPDSPVPSNSPDDIPVTSINILIYTGGHANARANQHVSFVQMSQNEQRVWFAVDSAPPLARVFYNRRYRTDAASPWYWQWAISPEIIDLPLGASAAVSAVLYRPSPQYTDTRTGIKYNYVMYLTLQPSSCVPDALGLLFIAFSNDGICWTSLQQAKQSGGETFSCFNFDPFVNVVPIEQMSAIDDGMGIIYMVGIDGTLDVLTNPANMGLSETNSGFATITNPSYINLALPQPQLTTAGMLSPTLWYTGRFTPYLYFINMQMAYDPAGGYLYIGRAYPYPFDRGDDGTMPAFPATPSPIQMQQYDLVDPATGLSSPVAGCGAPPALLPNRVQIYRMYLGALSSILSGQLYAGYWTLVGDYGHNAGYSNSF